MDWGGPTCDLSLQPRYRYPLGTHLKDPIKYYTNYWSI